MNELAVSTPHSASARVRAGAAVAYLAVLLVWCAVASAQNTVLPNRAPSSEARVTHILGFEDARKNSSGRLSIEGDDLQFQKGGDTPVRIKISSIRDFSTGETDKQVGGLPLTAAKAAVPFGGGRAVSLFSHKKYDTVSLEYLDANGGLHGAIFQLTKRQTLPEALVAKGVRFAPSEAKGQTLIVPTLEIEEATRSTDVNGRRGSRWSVEVDEVDPGEVSIEPAFRIAIYENLLHEVAKAKTFQQVFRSGDRDADSVANLLILKTTVEKYTPGSETRRAVTTVTGATKVTVRTRLCTREGRIVWEQVAGASVRFMGGNLRVTNKLARNVAHEMKSPRLDPVLQTLDSKRAGSGSSPVSDSE
jgi:hypothetical protein